MKSSSSRVGIFLVFSALSALPLAAGCSAQASSQSVGVTPESEIATTTTTTTTPAAAAPDGQSQHRPHGPDAIFSEALKNLTLSDSQRTAVEGLVAAQAKDRPAPDHAKIVDLAAKVRAGTIDANATDDMAAHQAEFAAHQKNFAAALANAARHAHRGPAHAARCRDQSGHGFAWAGDARPRNARPRNAWPRRARRKWTRRGRTRLTG